MSEKKKKPSKKKTNGYITGMAKVDASERASVIEAVLAGLAEGRTVADTCRTLRRSAGAVRGWMADDEDLYMRYRRARVLMGNALAEEAIQIARDSVNDTVMVDRLTVDTLKWASSKAAPQDYGDKQVVEHQGAQTISVKVVEENRPPAIAATARAVIASPVATLPAGVFHVEHGESTEGP